MTASMSTIDPWPDTSEVFSLKIGGVSVPLLLIAIMTFVLNKLIAMTSSQRKGGSSKERSFRECSVSRFFRSRSSAPKPILRC